MIPTRHRILTQERPRCPPWLMWEQSLNIVRIISTPNTVTMPSFHQEVKYADWASRSAIGKHRNSLPRAARWRGVIRFRQVAAETGR